MLQRASSVAPLEQYIIAGIIVSLLLHVALVLLLLGFKPEPNPLLEDVIEVSLSPQLLAPPPNTSKSPASRQIVSPPDRTAPDQAPDNARFLSDQNTRAEREQIHRGAGPDAGIPGAPGSHQPPARSGARSPPKQPAPAGPKTVPQNQRALEPSAPLKTLRLDDGAVSERFTESAPRPKRSLTQEILGSGSAAPPSEPFSRAFGTGARFLGSRGSSDHLPFLPDGDITLLNAKADQFAVFVRRVAIRVFSELRTSGWETLSAADIRSMQSDSTVIASLSLKGELLRVTLEGQSGSQRFDQVLAGAVKKGARDPNPPPEAVADDGTIRFIFKARSWSQMQSDARTGALGERRWLLLSTGLE